jgi:hypothetical protein
MRTFLVLAAVVVLAPFAAAKVRTRVYRCDEATPLAPVDAAHPAVYRDIMVGTHLVIVVSSDTGGEIWSGGLRLSGDDANNATLSGRGYDPVSFSYLDTPLPSAGRWAAAWASPSTEAFDIVFNNSRDAVAGDWFICDYRAERAGSATVKVYDYAADIEVLVETLFFTHVASRDFNRDGLVNFEDFALLAKHWRAPVAPDADSGETGFDLATNRRIDIDDLSLFTQYWLERTDCNEPSADSQNSPSVP